MKKITRLIPLLSIILCLTTPLIAKAYPTAPTITYNFDLDGDIYEDAFGCGKYNSPYTTCMISPIQNGTTLPVRIDAASSAPKTTQIRVSCINATTKTTVASKVIYATDHQYITFTDLNSSDYYYFKFVGSSNYYLPGTIYISKNGLFNF